MKKQICNCLRKLVLLMACTFLLDATVGGLSQWLFYQQRSGKWYRINRTMTSARERLFVFGSSHAASHYVPDVLESELGLSSYNAGVPGQQVLFHKTLESIVLQRVTPEVIILDVDPSTLYKSQDTYDRLADLKPFYHRHPDIIGPVLEQRLPGEPLFLRSKLYQYNSTFVHVARYWVAPQPDWNGYRPEHAAMRPPTPQQKRHDEEARQAYGAERPLDPVMVDALERFAGDARHKGARVFYFVSPGALPADLKGGASFLEIEAVVERSGIPFFNFRNHPGFVGHYELFADAGHLNDTGARRYSRLVAQSIRDYLGAKTPSVDSLRSAGSTPNR